MVSNNHQVAPFRGRQDIAGTYQRVDPKTGEVYSEDYNDGEIVQGRRVVDEDYRRELKQFNGFANDVNEGMTQEEIFNIIQQDINKVIGYDGLPTRPLSDFVGRTIKVTGSVFRSIHSFRSKEVVDETGQGALMAGYDKLVLRVGEILNSKREWVKAQDEDENDLLLATSAQQPCNLFEAAHNHGLQPGDFPDGCFMIFRVYKMGNAILVGPVKGE